jgi:hypothetical protein
MYDLCNRRFHVRISLLFNDQAPRDSRKARKEMKMPKVTASRSSKPRKWMQKAVKRPGALTAKAKRAGMSVQTYARKHEHDSGLTGEEARFAVTAEKVAKKRKAKR